MQRAAARRAGGGHQRDAELGLRGRQFPNADPPRLARELAPADARLHAARSRRGRHHLRLAFSGAVCEQGNPNNPDGACDVVIDPASFDATYAITGTDVLFTMAGDRPVDVTLQGDEHRGRRDRDAHDRDDHPGRRCRGLPAPVMMRRALTIALRSPRAVRRACGRGRGVRGDVARRFDGRRGERATRRSGHDRDQPGGPRRSAKRAQIVFGGHGDYVAQWYAAHRRSHVDRSQPRLRRHRVRRRDSPARPALFCATSASASRSTRPRSTCSTSTSPSASISRIRPSTTDAPTRSPPRSRSVTESSSGIDLGVGFAISPTLSLPTLVQYQAGRAPSVNDNVEVRIDSSLDLAVVALPRLAPPALRLARAIARLARRSGVARDGHADDASGRHPRAGQIAFFQMWEPATVVVGTAFTPDARHLAHARRHLAQVVGLPHRLRSRLRSEQPERRRKPDPAAIPLPRHA